MMPAPKGKAMLQEVFRAVPNAHPRLRVVAGFSNGGHCIDGLLSLPRCSFRRQFNVFVFADGGMALGDYRGLQNSFAYICWGEKSPQKSDAAKLRKKATRARMTVQAKEMTGIGHLFPPPHRQVANHWIEAKVLPVVARRELALAEGAERAGRLGEAVQALRGLQTVAVAGHDARVQALTARCETHAGKDWQKLKSQLGPALTDPGFKTAVEFRRRCAGTKAADQAAAWALPLARKKLKALKADLGDSTRRAAALVRLQQLEQEWSGTALSRECWKLWQSTRDKK